MCVSDVFLCVTVDVSIRAVITQQPPLSGVITPAPPSVNALEETPRLVCAGVCFRSDTCAITITMCCFCLFHCDLMLCSHIVPKCKPVTCKKTEHCALEGGVRDCYPTSHATCQGSGDPHYQSFDGRRFDFQGTCTYILSQHTKGLDQDLEPFQVLVQNENRGRNKAVAYTKSVSLTVFGNLTVSMSRADAGRMVVRLVTVLNSSPPH